LGGSEATAPRAERVVVRSFVDIVESMFCRLRMMDGMIESSWTLF